VHGLQDNVALIAVLEAIDAPPGQYDSSRTKQLICVANTHIHANPELNDVKLWQVHTLLKGLEKIANRWVLKRVCSFLDVLLTSPIAKLGACALLAKHSVANRGNRLYACMCYGVCLSYIQSA
jgi:hypothetical protein